MERQRNTNLIESVQDTFRYDMIWYVMIWYVTERYGLLLYDVVSHNDI